MNNELVSVTEMREDNNSNNGVSLDEELKNLRPRFSTIVNYFSKIYRLLIAVGFAVVVARKLSVYEYGLFTTILGLTGVFTNFYGLWSFWIPRFYARGRRDYVSNIFTIMLMYAPIAFILFLFIAYYYSIIIESSIAFFIVASPLVLLASINIYLRSIVGNVRPYVIGFVDMIRETTRLIIAFVMVYILMYKVFGALSSVVLSLVIAILMLYIAVKHYGIHVPKPRFNKELIKIIFKNTYIPLMITLNSILLQSERPILTALTVSTISTAYLSIAYIPRSVILQSSGAFTSGLSAKLLRVPSRIDIEDILRINLIVNIGMLFLLLSYSYPILSLFKPEYVEAFPLFLLFMFESFVMVLGNFFASIAYSLEKKDLYEHGKGLIHTPLFRIPLVMVLRAVFSILFGSLAIYIMYNVGVKDPVLMALPYPLLWFITSIPYIIFTYREAIRKIEFSIPKKEIIVSMAGGLIILLYSHLTGSNSILINVFWRDAPILGIHVLISISLYFVVQYSLSSWFRMIFKKSLRSIFKI